MKYMKLDQKGSAMAEYVWIDSTGETRSKSRVSKFLDSSPSSYFCVHFPLLFVVGRPQRLLAALSTTTPRCLCHWQVSLSATPRTLNPILPICSDPALAWPACVATLLRP